MICTICNERKDIKDGVFKPVGKHPKLGIPMKDFVCNKCAKAIGNKPISKEVSP